MHFFFDILSVFFNNVPKVIAKFEKKLYNGVEVICVRVGALMRDKQNFHRRASAVFKKLIEKFKKTYVKGSDYDHVWDRICENNRSSMIFLSSVGIGIFSILLLLGIFGLGIERKDVPVFLSALLFSGLLLLIMTLPATRDKAGVTMIASYLTMGAMSVYGIVISYLSPDQYTVTFIAMMCILSMTFVDKPKRIGLSHIAVTAICVGMVIFHKSDDLIVADLTNIISFSALSFVGGIVTVNTKAHGYIVDKLHAEDIEKGKKRLDIMETEALQLMTAVKSSYDMVVSVNLTKNTYKLIGEESFVTSGDKIEGCFDEVIDIHEKKVVKEHRELYKNTFSREGLLSAYASGKREVYLEYQQCDDSGEPHWLATHTMFIADPKSTDITEITISQNVDERVRLEDEHKAILKAERDRAEQAQKAKTDFLFQMSHDIRTPMNAIVGFTNFIRSSNDLDKIHNNYAVKLDTAAQQLLMLINDVLEMSRIESGKLEFHREKQDIRSTISGVMAVMQIQAEEKGVELISDLSVEHPFVNCDRNHMSRVIMNLLSNAVKFTPPKGKVTVSLHEKESSPEGCTAFEFKVADTGIGMSPEFIKRAFEPFEREQTSTSSGMQGTGLGLTIVKSIVETAGDRISVESRIGEGTVFTIDWTLLRAEADSLDDQSMTDGSAVSTESMSSYFKDKRILLVEDNEFNLTIAHVLLENAGFSVETATDGRVAVNKVINAPTPNYYDAILMDIQMPILNGYEATKEIRALPDSRRDTLIIALTANAFDTDKADSIAAGMNGHLAKPIDVTILYKTLWKLLNK